MNILVFNTLYYPNFIGGAEKSVQLLVESLIEKGYTVTVCSTDTRNAESNINGAQVKYIKIPNLYYGFTSKNRNLISKLIWHTIDSLNVMAYYIVRKALRDAKPDIIHTNNLAGFSVIVWKVAKNLNIPVVHTLRDYYLSCSSATRFKNGKRCEKQCISCSIFSLYKKKYSNYVDCVLGISDDILKRHLNEGYFNHVINADVIPNSVKKNNSIAVDEKRFNTIGYLGRVSPEKGIEILLKAFVSISKSDLKLLIGGDGDEDYVSLLKSEFKDSRIEFIGRVKPSDFFTKIDFVIVPSIWDEPFGRVVIESLSFGCPVIVSNRGGLQEIVKGKSIGLIFESEYVEDLIKKIFLYLNDSELFEKHRENTKNVVHDYSEDLVANKYINVYKKILNEGS